jgi:hypothetical protein
MKYAILEAQPIELPFGMVSIINSVLDSPNLMF